jgi:hypothetical protein
MPKSRAPEPEEPAQPEAAPEPSTEAEEPQPMNRAERRAHSKGKSVSTGYGRNPVKPNTGPASTHRQWANRRSG